MPRIVIHTRDGQRLEREVSDAMSRLPVLLFRPPSDDPLAPPGPAHRAHRVADENGTPAFRES